jgi:hypothetical protein
MGMSLHRESSLLSRERVGTELTTTPAHDLGQALETRLSSRKAYEKSLQASRESFRKIVAVIDPRLPRDSPNDGHARITPFFGNGQGDLPINGA